MLVIAYGTAVKLRLSCNNVKHGSDLLDVTVLEIVVR